MIRTLPASDDQIGSGVNVSGPLQIGNDWPGTFFRGDHSGAHSGWLHGIARYLDGVGERQAVAYARYLDELADEFAACIVKD